MNGQRFHQQKRIGTKTEQCERNAKTDSVASFSYETRAVLAEPNAIIHFGSISSNSTFSTVTKVTG